MCYKTIILENPARHLAGTLGQITLISMNWKKTISICTFILCSVLIRAQTQTNYKLIVNEDTLNISLDEWYELEIDTREKINFLLTQPRHLSYKTEMFEFMYPNDKSVSKTQIDIGINQSMVVSAGGNGYLIQEYNSMNPTFLTEFMLEEVVKESVEYGYARTDKKFKHKLASGHIIEGLQASLTYKGDTEIYTVASYGKKDAGILVMTMSFDDQYEDDYDIDDKKMIELFLNTLRIVE